MHPTCMHLAPVPVFHSWCEVPGLCESANVGMWECGVGVPGNHFLRFDFLRGRVGIGEPPPHAWGPWSRDGGSRPWMNLLVEETRFVRDCKRVCG